MEKIIFHIDVNSAFLSWTAVDLLNKGYKKDIRNIVSVIGGKQSNRNAIVLAKSIPSKKYGILSAETISSARSKYKDLEVYSPNYELYSMMSNKLFNILEEYTFDIEIASIDECYMDYGSVKNLYGDELKFAENLKKRIKKELGFTVNIGIANNKLCAKMASDFEKPDKIHTLYDYEIKTKMFPLPIGDLFGIGKETAEKLKFIGINSIKDLAEYDETKLRNIFKNRATDMIRIANGIDNSLVDRNNYIPKGISNEITLNEDVNDIKILEKKLFFLSGYISERLRKEKKYAYVVNIILKDSFFRRKNHQRKLKNPINSTNEIYEISKILLREVWDGEYIRLIGIRLDKFTDTNNYQTSFFEDVKEKEQNDKTDLIMDEINNKYGKKIIKRASYIDLKKK